MRVVVDTNVIVSAALKEKTLPSMALHVVAESGVLLKSTLTEQEPFITLARPKLAPLIPPAFHTWLQEVLAAAELVDIAERIVACRDPKDDKFLELAVGGRATSDGTVELTAPLLPRLLSRRHRHRYPEKFLLLLLLEKHPRFERVFEAAEFRHEIFPQIVRQKCGVGVVLPSLLNIKIRRKPSNRPVTKVRTRDIMAVVLADSPIRVNRG